MEMPKLSPVPLKTTEKFADGTIRQLSGICKVWTWLTSVRQWRVMEDWEYTFENNVFIIPKGFVFDGASIPKPLWFLLSPTGLLLIPGLVHDFAYRYDYLYIKDWQTGYKKHMEMQGQKHWDTMFYRIGNQVNAMPAINALAYLAIFSLGKLAWKQNRKRSAPEIKPCAARYAAQNKYYLT